MKREDILSILITFVMGLVIGGYLYLTQTAPITAKLATPKAESVDDFLLTGEAYGSCEPNCPAFRVSADSTYRYFHYVNGVRTPEDGELPLALRSTLHKYATVESFTMRAESAKESCDGDPNAIQARYEFEFEGKRFELDSCTTRIDQNGPLWNALRELWVYFAKYEDAT